MLSTKIENSEVIDLINAIFNSGNQQSNGIEKSQQEKIATSDEPNQTINFTNVSKSLKQDYEAIAAFIAQCLNLEEAILKDEFSKANNAYELLKEYLLRVHQKAKQRELPKEIERFQLYDNFETFAKILSKKFHFGILDKIQKYSVLPSIQKQFPLNYQQNKKAFENATNNTRETLIVFLQQFTSDSLSAYTQHANDLIDTLAFISNHSVDIKFKQLIRQEINLHKQVLNDVFTLVRDADPNDSKFLKTAFNTAADNGFNRYIDSLLRELFALGTQQEHKINLLIVEISNKNKNEISTNDLSQKKEKSITDLIQYLKENNNAAIWGTQQKLDILAAFINDISEIEKDTWKNPDFSYADVQNFKNNLNKVKRKIEDEWIIHCSKKSHAGAYGVGWNTSIVDSSEQDQVKIMAKERLVADLTSAVKNFQATFESKFNSFDIKPIEEIIGYFPNNSPHSKANFLKIKSELKNAADLVTTPDKSGIDGDYQRTVEKTLNFVKVINSSLYDIGHQIFNYNSSAKAKQFLVSSTNEILRAFAANSSILSYLYPAEKKTEITNQFAMFNSTLNLTEPTTTTTTTTTTTSTTTTTNNANQNSTTSEKPESERTKIYNVLTHKTKYILLASKEKNFNSFYMKLCQTFLPSPAVPLLDLAKIKTDLEALINCQTPTAYEQAFDNLLGNSAFLLTSKHPLCLAYLKIVEKILYKVINAYFLKEEYEFQLNFTVEQLEKARFVLGFFKYKKNAEIEILIEKLNAKISKQKQDPYNLSRLKLFVPEQEAQTSESMLYGATHLEDNKRKIDDFQDTLSKLFTAHSLARFVISTGKVLTKSSQGAAMISAIVGKVSEIFPIPNISPAIDTIDTKLQERDAQAAASTMGGNLFAWFNIVDKIIFAVTKIFRAQIINMKNPDDIGRFAEFCQKRMFDKLGSYEGAIDGLENFLITSIFTGHAIPFIKDYYHQVGDESILGNSTFQGLVEKVNIYATGTHPKVEKTNTSVTDTNPKNETYFYLNSKLNTKTETKPTISKKNLRYGFVDLSHDPEFAQQLAIDISRVSYSYEKSENSENFTESKVLNNHHQFFRKIGDDKIPKSFNQNIGEKNENVAGGENLAEFLVKSFAY